MRPSEILFTGACLFATLLLIHQRVVDIRRAESLTSVSAKEREEREKTRQGLGTVCDDIVQDVINDLAETGCAVAFIPSLIAFGNRRVL